MHLFYALATATAIALALGGTHIVIASEPDAQGAAPTVVPAGETLASSGDPADVVLTINGVAIPRAELERNARPLLARMGPADSITPDQRKLVEETAKENLIRSELLFQLAKDQNIPDLDRQVEEQFALIKSRSPSEEEWNDALAKKGITPDGLHEQLKRGLMINAFVQNEVVSKIEITDAQLKAVYDEHPESFSQPESMRASHVLIGVDADAGAEEKENAKRKADEILEKVKSGADFAELAKSESTCPSAAQGGDLGEFGRGQMVAPFENAAFALKSGDLSEVVETQFGYHIIKATDKKPAAVVPFEEVKVRIEKQLKTQQVQRDLMAKIEALRATSVIESPAQNP
ncbi:peptidylprolyl isomerase [Thiocapsa marina]|uniref:peptidylprolyl isomerase n=1 Tax=Thiocapsa marina 5811 TaxID=768671 RepID=F9UGI6_9GAMM|nr:peptidylprolyl isomerase [Thiocapsa marina]EGV16669.1 PpiC-type peptidyl-prolyl cis-trans isomerase [Thiocapsa marina 5811]